jgi:hypothetical protein
MTFGKMKKMRSKRYWFEQPFKCLWEWGDDEELVKSGQLIWQAPLPSCVLIHWSLIMTNVIFIIHEVNRDSLPKLRTSV